MGEESILLIIALVLFVAAACIEKFGPIHLGWAGAAFLTLALLI